MNKKDNGIVSVIIPSYNSGKYLGRSIESALSQDYANCEIIVVDDGSTDDTSSVVKPYQNKVKYIYKENGGPASARNLGVRHSSGDLIAFLDADDYWLPGKISLQVQFLKRNSEYGMVHANTFINIQDKELLPCYVSKLPPAGWVFKELFNDNMINNLTVVLRRYCFEELNGFDESRKLIGIEDYDLWLRIAVKYKIGFLDKVVAVYNVHDTNISDEEKAIKSQIFLLRKFVKNESWIANEYPDLFNEKLERISFRYACRLMQKEIYVPANQLFSISVKRHYLRTSSIIGLIFSFLKSNVLFKDRVTSLRYKRYGNFFMRLGAKQEALKCYLKAIKLFPLQKSVYQSIAKMF